MILWKGGCTITVMWQITKHMTTEQISQRKRFQWKMFRLYAVAMLH